MKKKTQKNTSRDWKVARICLALYCGFAGKQSHNAKWVLGTFHFLR